MKRMVAAIVIVLIGVVFAYWTVRAGSPRSSRPDPEPLAVRTRFVPIGTTRVVTLPGTRLAPLQSRRLRSAVDRHRARGWELIHDPLPPAWAPAEWTLTFRKVR